MFVIMKTNQLKRPDLQRPILTKDYLFLQNTREPPTNMNTQFCLDMINSLQAPCENPENPCINGDYVFITSRGHVYRKTQVIDGIEKRYVWTILHNNNGACGWYRVDSPVLHKIFYNGDLCISMTDGSMATMSPYEKNTQVFHIKNLKYCLDSPIPQEQINTQSVLSPPWNPSVNNQGKEELHLYISHPKYGGDMLLGHMYPLLLTKNTWTTSPEITDSRVLAAWRDSRDLSSLPHYEPSDPLVNLPVFFQTGDPVAPISPIEPELPPTSRLDQGNVCMDLFPELTENDLDECMQEQPEQVKQEASEQEKQDTPGQDWRGLFKWDTVDDNSPLGPWSQKNDDVSNDLPNVEYRYDPFDHCCYTKEEFFDYYGNNLVWDVMEPKKDLQRAMIESMIERGQNVLSSKEIIHLLDRMIETFV